MTTIKAIARVQVTIEIHLTQPWQPVETIGEAHRQAKAQALEEVRRLKNIQVVSVPLVQVISFESGDG